MSGLYITDCIHGLDLRVHPRCYLCQPEVRAADPGGLRAELRRRGLDGEPTGDWSQWERGFRAAMDLALTQETTAPGDANR